MTSVTEPLNVIYGLSCTCHPGDGVRYVGQTMRGADKRFMHHLRSAINPPKKAQRLPVHAWMAKHGVENTYCSVLESADSASELDDREVWWIGHCGTYATAKGLNLTIGGGGARGFTRSDEQRAAMSVIMGGRKPSLSTVEGGRKLMQGMTGEKNYMAKLTDARVAEIRYWLWSGYTITELGGIFGINISTVWQIKTGKTWKHVAWPIGPAEKTRTSEAQSESSKAHPGGERKFTESDVLEIRRIAAAGKYSQKGLAERFGVSRGAIYAIVRRTTWKHVA